MILLRSPSEIQNEQKRKGERGRLFLKKTVLNAVRSMKTCDCKPGDSDASLGHVSSADPKAKEVIKLSPTLGPFPSVNTWLCHFRIFNAIISFTLCVSDLNLSLIHI